MVRRGDVTEKEWWWARNSRDQLGYIPRNLLGVCFFRECVGNFLTIFVVTKKYLNFLHSFILASPLMSDTLCFWIECTLLDSLA